MRVLVSGERAAMAGEVTLSLDVALRPPLALALIALDAGRRASGDFPAIDTVARELRPGASFDEAGALRIRFCDLPVSVERLVFAAFLTTGPGGGLSFRELAQVELRAEDWRFPIPLADRADTALVLAELYRHAGGWRVSANGQGFAFGLPALADAYGADRDWAKRVSAQSGGADAPREADRERLPDMRGGVASGSGVAIDPHHLLTNAHVVADAQAISVSGEGRTCPAAIVFADPQNDLALLRVAEPLPAVARLREGIELHLGEEVVALGFPLQGLLGSGPQASAGNVAALSGMGNDTSVFQFSAPIASGNSGGPILDAGGLIVGLVCSSLNVERIRAGGGSAENINFGIKGAAVRSFLDAFGMTPMLGGPGPVIARAAMVRAARASLYRVTCTC